jgi:hypothetical protein
MNSYLNLNNDFLESVDTRERKGLLKIVRPAQEYVLTDWAWARLGLMPV